MNVHNHKSDSYPDDKSDSYPDHKSDSYPDHKSDSYPDHKSDSYPDLDQVMRVRNTGFYEIRSRFLNNDKYSHSFQSIDLLYC